MANTLKFGNGEWYGKEGTILAYNDENRNYKPLPFNFERSSSATTINKQGLIETVGANEPRIDYKDNTKGALLLEPTRSNVITNSNNLTTWNGAAMTRTLVDDLINPSNGLEASKLTQTSSGGYAWLSRTFTGNETFSAFVKKDSSNFVRLYAANNTVYFDIVNGTVETEVGSDITDKSIIDYGNGWFRISMSVNSTAASYVRIYPASSGSSSSGTNSLFVYGVQLEQGSYATSYIPTSGGAVTRVYDTMPTYLDLTPLNIGNSYTLFLDADLNVNDNNKVFGQIINSSNLTSFTIRNNVGGIRLYNQIDGSYPVSGITSSTNKFVIRVDGNSYKVFVQGSSLSGALTTQRDLGSLNFYGQNTELKINNFTIDDTALSDAECQALVN